MRRAFIPLLTLLSTLACSSALIGGAPVSSTDGGRVDEPAPDGGDAPPTGGPPVSAAVDGVCGGANETSVSAAPTSGLCSVGEASAVGGSGPWTWTCAGSNGGADAACSAAHAEGGGTRLPAAGNPDGGCTTQTLPPEAKAVDTSNPTTVVGSGTAASCTGSALAAAVKKGGIITFNCGTDVATVDITETLKPPLSNKASSPVSIVIDGADKITLDGQAKFRIIDWEHSSARTSKDTLTLQHLRIINAKPTPTEPIPACPASGSISNKACSSGFNGGQGGAIYMYDGSLRLIDTTFENNQGAQTGPDTGGGAIYMYQTSYAYIVGSTFKSNSASNGGAVAMLWSGAYVYNSLFVGNAATGFGANNDDSSQCTCINNNQNEIGSGGNGGALYKDGADGMNLTLCGDLIVGNKSNAIGAATFLTADGSSSHQIIYDSDVENDTSRDYVGVGSCPGIYQNPHGAVVTGNSRYCSGTGTGCQTTCPN